MITNIQEFKKYLLKEEVDPTMNSMEVVGEEQKQQQINGYNSILKNYNAKKNSFLPIFKKDAKDWEKEAIKIYQIEINKSDNKKYNNKYLVMQWEIEKLKKQLETIQAQLKAKQETPVDPNATIEQTQQLQDQEKNMIDNIKIIQTTVKDKELELKLEIQEDLKEIQKLK